MKKLWLLLFALPALAQINYVTVKSTSLSSAAEVITVQQPTAPTRSVNIVGIYVDCSVACVVQIERNGALASGSNAQTISNVSSGEAATTCVAYNSSNVGSGTVLGLYQLQAGGQISIPFSNVKFELGTKNQNFTVRTSSITGTVDIVVQFTEK